MDAMLVLKATALLAVTLFAARALRRAAAATRHRLWTLAFAAVLALPLLASALPALPVPGSFARPMAVEPDDQLRRRTSHGRPDHIESLLSPSVPSLDAARDDLEPAEGPKDARHAQDAPVERRAERSWFDKLTTSGFGASILFVWLLGSAAAVATLLLSLVRARRLSVSGEDLGDPAWRAAADALAARLGLQRSARLVVNQHVATPMAGGVWHPVIFLPSCARAWSAEQRDVVLAHELAHLAGRDPLRHLTARLAVALYWFHPLAWIAARQATVAREQACDEAVLALGTRPSAYARVLLDLAESMVSPRPPVAVLPMVERSLLETRLMAILNDDVRPVKRRGVLMPAISTALLTLAVAAAQPAARASTAPVSTPLVSTPPVALPPTAVAVAAPTRVAPVASTPAPAPQVNADSDSACWWDPLDSRSFNGSISSPSSGGRTVIAEQVGTRGVDRVIQKTFDGLRVCMLAEDVGDRGAAERPSQWPGRARRVIMETRRGGTVQRLEIARQPGGGSRTVWRVGGADRPFDASAERWRDRLLGTLDAIWDLSTLRGEVSSLRGQISSIRGHQSSIRGEISSLRGHVSSLRGRISSIRGEESSLRGQISSINGHVSSMRGAISSERGAISSLNGTRYRATDDELRQIRARIDRHEAEIARIEQEVRDYNADAKVAAVEREIRDLNTDGKIAAIETEIRAFDLDAKVAAAERRIGDLDVDGKIAAIERQIAALDADRRSRELEGRRDAELKQLEAAIAAIR